MPGENGSKAGGWRISGKAMRCPLKSSLRKGTSEERLEKNEQLSHEKYLKQQYLGQRETGQGLEVGVCQGFPSDQEELGMQREGSKTGLDEVKEIMSTTELTPGFPLNESGSHWRAPSTGVTGT